MDISGSSVSSAGDVNGDGIDDVLIGAPHHDDPGSVDPAGMSYIVFGRNTAADGDFAAEFELSSLQAANGGDGSTGFVIKGIDAEDWSGYSVSSAGDINGDGVDDVLIGAYGADPNNTHSGESYVVFGRNAAVEGDFAAEFELSSLLVANGGNGTNGFVIYGVDIWDWAGYSVNPAGDVNGDGFGDILIGARHGDLNDIQPTGETYVIYGNKIKGAEFNLRSLTEAGIGLGWYGFVINGIDSWDFAGHSVSSTGDMNGDGFDDILIGAYAADPNGVEAAGESYVVFGRSHFSAEFELSSLLAANGGDGSEGFVINGIDENDVSGYSVSSAGDINGDGMDDLLIGASRADPGDVAYVGESYVVFGRHTASEGNYAAEFELSSLLAANGGDGTAGFVMYGIDHFDFSGVSVSSAGDVNGDGIDDVLIGAIHADPNGVASAGESYVVYGRIDQASLINTLITRVEYLDLSTGAGSSLTHNLDSALHLLDMEVATDASLSAKLDAFIRGVTRLYDRGQISWVDGSNLVQVAVNIIGESVPDTWSVGPSP
jgi:hypothetical protein